MALGLQLVAVFALEAQRKYGRKHDAAWQEASELDTVHGYHDFLESWPESPHLQAALLAIDEEVGTDWEAASGSDSLFSYAQFRRTYQRFSGSPFVKSRYLAEAEAKIEDLQTLDGEEKKALSSQFGVVFDSEKASFVSKDSASRVLSEAGYSTRCRDESTFIVRLQQQEDWQRATYSRSRHDSSGFQATLGVSSLVQVAIELDGERLYETSFEVADDTPRSVQVPLGGDDEHTRRSLALRENLPHLLPVGTLVGAVLGVLILGAVLRSGEAPNGADPRPAAVSEGRSAEPTPQDRTLQAAAGRPADKRALAGRVEADLERMAAAGGGFTAQLALLCDAARVQQILDRFGDHRPLHVLPTFHEDRACFLVCWNRYSTPKLAKQARDLPAPLRSIQPEPLPKEISKILQ